MTSARCAPPVAMGAERDNEGAGRDLDLVGTREDEVERATQCRPRRKPGGGRVTKTIVERAHRPPHGAEA